MTPEQELSAFEAWAMYKADLQKGSAGEYVDIFARVMLDAWQARAALQSQDREDAGRLQAMAAEWDRARRGVDSHMPIWDSLCDALGADADGAGMRAAIDHARRVEEDGE